MSLIQDFDDTIETMTFCLPDFKVCTTTVSFRLSNVYVGNLDQFKEIFNSIADDFNVWIAQNFSCGVMRLRDSGNFRNGIEFEFAKVVEGKKKPSKKAVKLFGNGSLHITGCQTLQDSEVLATILIKLLSLVLQREDIEKSEVKIDMINTVFKLLHKVNAIETVQNLSTAVQQINMPCSVTYDKARFAAVNIKIGVEKAYLCTFFVRANGTVQMSGVKGLDALKMFTELFSNTFAPALCPDLTPEVPKVPKKRGRKRKIEDATFYDELRNNLDV